MDLGRGIIVDVASVEIISMIGFGEGDEFGIFEVNEKNLTEGAVAHSWRQGLLDGTLAANSNYENEREERRIRLQTAQSAVYLIRKKSKQIRRQFYRRRSSINP